MQAVAGKRVIKMILIWCRLCPSFEVVRPSSCRRDTVVEGAARRFFDPRGVTLLELVMVIFVIGLMLGISLPIASSLAGRLRAGSARDTFVNFYARARAAAVQFGGEGRLHIEANNGQFWVEVDTGQAGAVAADTIGVVLSIAREFGGVTMFSARQVLCFDARGLPFTGGQCEPHDSPVIFQSSTRADTIQFSLGGTIVAK